MSEIVVTLVVFGLLAYGLGLLTPGPDEPPGGDDGDDGAASG